MRRHLRLILVVGLALSISQFLRPVPAQITAPPARDAEMTGCKILGVATCASMACHGANGPKATARSEYSTWIAVDPHAKAYQTLFNERSVRMQKLLAEGDPAQKGLKAHQNKLCLACHGMGENVPARLQGDGVGCERCHGPAEKWNNTHYLTTFDRKTPGFVDMRDNMETRIVACMKCHVGDKNQEVNHDLIAAGHPRLKFEFAAYYANYPRHWAGDPDTRYKDAEARRWVLGQLVSTRSALELLQARAADDKKPWPEFAEYDCAACHHGLTKPSFRQDNALQGAAKGAKLRAGDLPWGTWYTALLPTLSLKARGPGDALRVTGKDIKDIDLLMRKRYPNRKKVAASAGKMAGLLDRWIKTQGKTPARGGADLTALMKSLASEGDLARGWDEATQQYLGLAALHQAISDQGGSNPQLKAALIDLRKQLQGSFDKGSDPLYDSPNKFDPKTVRDRLKSVLERIK